jgi:uncharacterized protein
MDPVVLFFILGLVATLLKSEIKIPEAFYNVLSIYLLLAIGIKGGIELYNSNLQSLMLPAIGTILLGVITTLVAYFILIASKKFDKTDAIAIATHYGSVSAVTYAVVTNFLEIQKVSYEKYSTVLLVLLEIPAIIVGAGLARMLVNKTKSDSHVKEMFREVFLGKSILLLLGGLVIGYYMSYSNNFKLNIFFADLFRGFLSLFLLEMGIVTGAQLSDLKKAGIHLVMFGILIPIVSAVLGILGGKIMGLSFGGTVVVATMCASASYIAAPAAVKMVLPKANPTYYMTASLGITFPFNIIFGIQLYYWLAGLIY